MDRLEQLIHGEPCYAIKVLTFSATSAIMRNLGLATCIENGMNFPQFALVLSTGALPEIPQTKKWRRNSTLAFEAWPAANTGHTGNPVKGAGSRSASSR